MKGVHKSDYDFLFALTTRFPKLVYIKGTVSCDFVPQVFIFESSSPKPLKITLGSFRIFSKIHGDIRIQGASPVSMTSAVLPPYWWCR
jgi:hypothetical protein